MSEVKLEPKNVFQIFSEINKVPRPSGHEEKMGEYLRDFAERHSLDFKIDGAGNVLISAKATPGYENRQTVVLQAHQDMVCEKNKDVDFDFSKDAIQTHIDGEWLWANGTTLGADDGLGIAMALAAVTDDSVEHGPVECFFTVDEERGLTGAAAVQAGFMTGNILINLDSEDEGQIFVGCAGGVRTEAKFHYTEERVPAGYMAFKIQVKNGQGGHSGGDIHLGRANANKQLVRFIYEMMQKYDVILCEYNGGGLHNAIPREAAAVIAVPTKDKESLRIDANLYCAEIREEYKATEPDMDMLLESTEATSAIDAKTARNLIYSLMAVDNGVFAMSQAIAGLVETSSNLASIKMGPDNTIIVLSSQRSSAPNGTKVMSETIASCFQLAGAEVEIGDGYPGWSPNLDSPILKIAQKTYVELFGKEPEVLAIHAGLECGLFKEKYPAMDMISFGPTLRDVHSPKERLHIPAVKLCWDHLLEILKNIPE